MFGLTFAAGACIWGSLVYANPGCPEYTIIETLQLEKFLGRWYVALHHDSSEPTEDKCMTFDVTLNSVMAS